MSQETTKVSMGPSPLRLIKEGLEKKAEEQWVKSEIRGVSAVAEEAKRIALGVKSNLETRKCKQEKTIEEIMKEIRGWRTVKMATFIAAFTFLAMGLLQFFTLKAQADGTEKSQKSMVESVEAIQSTSETNSVTFRAHIEQEKATQAKEEIQEREQLKAIEDTVKKAMRTYRRRR